MFYPQMVKNNFAPVSVTSPTGGRGALKANPVGMGFASTKLLFYMRFLAKESRKRL
jgi:hypothetical protein